MKQMCLYEEVRRFTAGRNGPYRLRVWLGEQDYCLAVDQGCQPLVVLLIDQAREFQKGDGGKDPVREGSGEVDEETAFPVERDGHCRRSAVRPARASQQHLSGAAFHLIERNVPEDGSQRQTPGPEFA